MLPTQRSQKEKNYLKKIYLIYGQPKSGKTTIASQFGDDDKNKVLFFATEPGHKFQEIYKYEILNKTTGEVRDPIKWNDFLDCCREIAQGGHDFKSIVIDVADNLWKWCSDYVCNENGIQHESDLGFGKGYALIKNEFLKPINYLAQLGYGLIFVSHEQTSEKQVGPRKISYTDSTLPSTAKKVIHGISDYILYFHSDADGSRLIRTKGTENVNAGDRSGKLDPFIPMDAKKLIEELNR
jgi:hypothetical protein